MMNLYSFFDIEHTSNLNLPDAECIETILNDVVTPKLNSIGLSNKKKKYIWEGEYNENGIKPIVQFTYRGTNGHFFVGTNFKFVPTITQNKKTVYYNHKLQVFENSEHFDKDYAIRLWNESFFNKSLKKFINANIKKISKFLNRLDKLEANITLVKNQIASDEFRYETRDPNLPYVLAYLYHKQNNLLEAEEMKTLFLSNNEDYDDSIFSSFD